MRGNIAFNKEYKTGKQVLSTDWHAANYFHTLVKDVIKFDEQGNIYWYQEIVLDAGGGYGQYVQNIKESILIGKYTISIFSSMIEASISFNNFRKEINGSFSINDKDVVLDITTYFKEKLVEKRAYCFSLED